MSIKTLLRGTGVAIITPFNENKSVDYNSLGKLIDWQIENQVNYIVLLGTTGETPVLSQEEKIELIHFVSGHIHQRVPLVIGVGGNNTLSVVNDLKSLPL